MKRFAVLGWPVTGSLSPFIHNFWYKKYAIEAQYEAKKCYIGGFAAQINLLRDSGFSGCNCTMPLKQAAYALADNKDPIALKLQAANTLVFANKGIQAFNTDVYGVLQTLRSLPGFYSSAVVFGGGGAAAAAAYALKLYGCKKIAVSTRQEGQAEETARRVGAPCAPAPWGQKSAIEDCLLWFNATGSSLEANKALLGLHGCQAAIDAAYTPAAQAFLAMAQQAGASLVLNGVPMLVWQAQQAFKIWLGFNPDASAVLQALTG